MKESRPLKPIPIRWIVPVYESEAERDAALAHSRETVLKLARLPARAMAQDDIHAQRKLVADRPTKRTTWCRASWAAPTSQP